MDSITFRKLIMSDIPVFIKLRLKQLQEEGAEPTFDLTKPLFDYYERHINDGTFISCLL